MTARYYNYTTLLPTDWWGRRSFLNAWWRFDRGDPRWTPPNYRSLVSLVQDQRAHSGGGFYAQPIYMEALPQRTGGQTGYYGSAITGAYFEEVVAAAIIQIDPRREDGAAYLSLLKCANDEETLERLLGKVMEVAGEFGCERVIGPTGPTPSWQAGALQNYFNLLPPLHTPYNPPYLADLLATTMEPRAETALFWLNTPGESPNRSTPVATITPLDPARLATDLLPLLAASLASTEDLFPEPDAEEATTLLRWLQVYPVTGWQAEVDDEVVGFVLVQPDLSALMRSAGGGRRLPWRWHPAVRRSPTAGRILLGAVAETWQHQGIATQLWNAALDHARKAGWRELTCGPVPLEGAAANFLRGIGAQPRQRYILYEWAPW
ncbi:MAG: GNAT family N-acetyltransferase [Anaerolineales bacterium]|nr:GNAT family N-acetyltransferase [Anaerolineales bacterium]